MTAWHVRNGALLAHIHGAVHDMEEMDLNPDRIEVRWCEKALRACTRSIANAIADAPQFFAGARLQITEQKLRFPSIDIRPVGLVMAYANIPGYTDPAVVVDTYYPALDRIEDVISSKVC